jgi:hypothetical protein
LAMTSANSTTIDPAILNCRRRSIARLNLCRAMSRAVFCSFKCRVRAAIILVAMLFMIASLFLERYAVRTLRWVMIRRRCRFTGGIGVFIPFVCALSRALPFAGSSKERAGIEPAFSRRNGRPAGRRSFHDPLFRGALFLQFSGYALSANCLDFVVFAVRCFVQFQKFGDC